MYINISCKCDTNRAGHFTLDAYASRPVACLEQLCSFIAPGIAWVLQAHTNQQNQADRSLNGIYTINMQIPTVQMSK